MNEKEPQKQSLGMRLSFACGEVGDNTALNIFTYLIFTFYFCVVRLPISYMTIGFIIWALWNAFNDPLIGYLSDRTKSRWGRRVPWMMGATIPLGVVMILFFTPPVALNSDLINFIYFMCILFAFDLAYTAFNLNYNALFSEMFVDMKKRASTGKIRLIFVMLGCIFAFTFPGFIIDDMTNLTNNPETLSQYMLTGLFAAIIIFVFYFIILKWGVREPKHISKDAETAMGFTSTMKHTLKHKSFLLFLFPALGTWLVLNILPTLAPLFFVHAIGIYDAELIGLLLMLYFIISAASMPLWEIIRVKKGARTSGLIGITVWIVSILPFAFTEEGNFIMALITLMFMGFGMGGALYFYDQCIAEIVDEDEIKQGTRRSGIYYAVLNFLIRFMYILNFIVIGIAFSAADWMNYQPNPGVDAILALRILMGVYPAIVLGISLIGMYFYPIRGERLAENRRKLIEMHEKKLSGL